MESVYKKLAKHMRIPINNAKKYLSEILEKKLVLKIGSSGSFIIISPEPLNGVEIYDRNYFLLKDNLPLKKEKVWVTSEISTPKDPVIRCILEYYNISPYK